MNSRQPLFEHVRGRVGQSGVDVAKLLEGEEIRRVFRVSEAVARRLVERDRPRQRVRVRRMACV